MHLAVRQQPLQEEATAVLRHVVDLIDDDQANVVEGLRGIVTQGVHQAFRSEDFHIGSDVIATLGSGEVGLFGGQAAAEQAQSGAQGLAHFAPEAAQWGDVDDAAGIERLLAQTDPLELEMGAILGALGFFDEWTLRQTLDLFEEHRVYDSLMALPEAVGCWSFTDRTTRGNPVPVDITRAVNEWMSGVPIPSLAAAWLPDVAREWALEQAVENISRTLEHVLSWTLGALINLVNNRLLAGGALTRLNADAAWHLRHGVDTEQAMSLLTSGIASRRLAYLVGQRAQRESIPTAELQAWLTELHINGWKQEFTANEYEIADLLEYVRRSRDLFTELLDHDQTTIPVTVVEDINATYTDVAVTTVGPGPSELVVSLHGQKLATVPASSHSDVAAVLDSGLEIAFTLRGSDLHLKRIQG